MITLCLILNLAQYASRAHAAEITLPRYGSESTLTHPRLKMLCGERCHEFWRQTMNDVATSTSPVESLRLWGDRFPIEYALFENFVRRATGHSSTLSLRPHKLGLASIRYPLGDEAWIQYQFEYQAIEAQTKPSTLAEYLRQVPRIDAAFFEPGREMGLVPERDWGMGHLHEGLRQGYPSGRPEVLRNRIVAELEWAYVWPLFGPDIEASVHWETHAGATRRFGRWLVKWDRWLLGSRDGTDPDRPRRTAMAMLYSVWRDPVFAMIDRESKETLSKTIMAAISVPNEVEASDEMLRLVQSTLFHVALTRMLEIGFATITHGSGSCTVSIKQHRNLGTEQEFGDTSLEFRRIPAHANADEAAQWMRLLQGHWRRAHDRTDLPVLIEPQPPRTRGENLKLARAYVRAAGMNPLDFARFLPPDIAAILPTDDPEPRWSALRATVLCEQSLTPSAPTPAGIFRLGQWLRRGASTRRGPRGIDRR